MQSCINIVYSIQSLTGYKLSLSQEQGKGRGRGIALFPGLYLAFCRLKYIFYYLEYDRKLDEGLRRRQGGEQGYIDCKVLQAINV